MGRAPCCDKANVKRGPWSPEEDMKLKEFIEKHGTGGNWIALPQKAGLKRCGKSCRLRWLNYLRPNIKHGEFSDTEDRIICNLFATIGSRWSIIAGHLPGRTDNDIKNYWNTKLKKKLLGIGPSQRKPQSHHHQQQQLQHQQQSLQQVFPSSFQPTVAPTSSPFQIPTPKSSLSNLDTFQISHTDLLNTVSTTALFQDPTHQQYHIKDGGNSTLLVFGSGEQNYTPKMEYEHSGLASGGLWQQMNFESLLCNNGFDENQKLMLTGIGGEADGHLERGNESTAPWGQAPLDYGNYEDIKQLISSTNGRNNPFSDDQNSATRGGNHKSQEMTIYYSL